MKNTIQGTKPIRGNLRGYSIQEPFPTLAELLTNLPESIAFDVEMSQ